LLFKEIISEKISAIINDLFSIDVSAHIEQSKLEKVGDFSTNIAMILAGKLKTKPLDIANKIIERLENADFLENVNVTNPGFINFHVSKKFLNETLCKFYNNFEQLIKINIGENKKYNIEFVSANPTGPLNVVNARAASTGAALANLLKRIGYDVTKEFYINDAGNQIEIFANSVRLRYLELFGEKIDFPPDHYQGEYVIEIAKEIKKRRADKYINLSETEQRAAFKDLAKNIVLEWQKSSLKDYGVEFDVWYSEYDNLHQTGKVMQTLEYLKNNNLTIEEDGAICLNSKKSGDDKNRALLKSNGIPTYFLADLAYHRDKFERGFEYILDLWGPDHHGHIKRTEIGLKMMNLNVNNFKVMIIQQVNFIDNGEHLKMSKRKGQIITLNELMADIPNDVSKFFFLMRNSDSHLDFDIQLAKTESQENPVYYVQYANARIKSIFRKLEEEDARLFQTFKSYKFDNLDKLSADESERELMKIIVIYTDEIKGAALNLQPHRITNYLRKLAAAFHSYYNKISILSENDEQTKLQRLALIDCASKVFVDALKILNISAPEKM